MVTPNALPRASSREVSSGSAPTFWIVPGSGTNPGPPPLTTGWANASLVAPPQKLRIFSSRLTSASDRAWAVGSPAGVWVGAVGAATPAVGWTAWGCARGAGALADVRFRSVPSREDETPHPASH